MMECIPASAEGYRKKVGIGAEVGRAFVVLFER
jgi:hypothetical protein